MSTERCVVRRCSISAAKCSVIVKCHTSSSCFSCTRSFVDGTLPLQDLGGTLHLKGLNTRIMLVSRGTFRRVRFVSTRPMRGRVCCPGFLSHSAATERACGSRVGGDHACHSSVFIVSVLERRVGGSSPHVRQVVSR